MITTRIGKRNLVRSCAFAVAAAWRSARAPARGPRRATPAADSAHREEAKAEFDQGNVAYNLGQVRRGDRALREGLRPVARARDPVQPRAVLPQALGGRQEERARAARAALLPGAGARGAAVARARRRRSVHRRARAGGGAGGGARAAGADRQRARRRGAAAGADVPARRPARRRGVDRRPLLHEPDNGRELLAEAYVVRGRTAARLGDALGAEAQFRRALELRPSAELTDAAPAESAAFEAARRTVAPGGLRLVQAPVGEVPAGKPSEIALTVEGDSEQMVATLELGYRRGDGGAFVTTRAPYAPIGAACTGAVRARQPADRGRPARGGAGDPGRGAGRGHARRVLRARAQRAGQRARRERHRPPCPSACRSPRRRSPPGPAARRARAHALVQALVGLDDRRRGRDRRRRRGLRRHARGGDGLTTYMTLTKQ